MCLAPVEDDDHDDWEVEDSCQATAAVEHVLHYMSNTTAGLHTALSLQADRDHTLGTHAHMQSCDGEAGRDHTLGT